MSMWKYESRSTYACVSMSLSTGADINARVYVYMIAYVYEYVVSAYE